MVQSKTSLFVYSKAIGNKENWLTWLDWFGAIIKKKEKISDIEKKDFLFRILENIIVNYDYEEKVHKLKVNFKLPVIIEEFVNKKGGISSARKYSISSESLVKSADQSLNVGNYSTVIGSGSKIAKKSTQNRSYSLKMSVEFVSSNLWTPQYSDYQMFLFQTIEDFTKKGWNYVQIADWFNKNEYKTPRGKRFRQNHVWSIHIKKKRSIERFSREYQPKITDMKVDVIDI